MELKTHKTMREWLTIASLECWLGDALNAVMPCLLVSVAKRVIVSL